MEPTMAVLTPPRQMQGPSTLKSMRASSVGQRSPLSSTTSTSKRATSEPFAWRPWGPVMGVSLMAEGAPAVSILSSQTTFPPLVPSARISPASQAMLGKGNR